MENESEMEKKEVIKNTDVSTEKTWEPRYKVLQAPKNRKKTERSRIKHRNKKRLRSMKNESELYLENHFQERYGV